VPPVHFIPLAESSGLITGLTRALMRQVCAEAGATIGARPGFRIGFNLSARHFTNEEIVEDVRRIFSRSPIALRQVLLEVTEREALANLTMARRVIAALQGLGVHVGIDDLGTGHSGLSYMLKLGVDFIKIGKIFVDTIDTERYSSTIIETWSAARATCGWRSSPKASRPLNRCSTCGRVASARRRAMSLPRLCPVRPS
jgi:EAL domain-containing protein (putative c-di-GMP-specific phosphodiesterase class I)